MINEFRFDKADHSYWLGKTRLLSVTEVIQLAGLKDYSQIDPGVLERASKRGTAVHAACHYLDEGDLDWATVSPEIEPYVRAWERFKKETGVELLGIEKPLFHATLGYAGTPDRVVNLYPHKGIIDLKTYAPDAVTGIQLAGYSYLEFGPQPTLDAPKRWGLWLKDDGKYSLKTYEDRGDERIFLACLDLCKWKRSQK